MGGDERRPRDESEDSAVRKAINSLHFRRHVEVDGNPVELVLLVHPAFWRPLQAGWWTGKEVCIVGADVSGNFLLRHSDGSILYWSHDEARAIPVSPSVRAFLDSLR